MDLWQLRRNPTTRVVTENYTLPGALVRALHGKTLTTSPTKCYGIRVQSAPRIPNPDDDNLLHDALTVEINRVL